MSPVIARSAEMPRPPGPPRPLEVPPPPVPFPPPHVPVVPPPPLHANVTVPQVRMLAPMWEYKHLTRTADAAPLDEAELNTLGHDGWELTGVVTDGRTTHFYFKRERS